MVSLKPAGSFEETGNMVAQGVNHVDPQLLDILQTAAQLTGMQVQAYSGYRPGDARFHGKGMATDIRIIGPDGQPLPNYQTPETFSAYETLAQAARQVQQQKYPDLDKQFRWGGYFSGDKGKYGAMDLMHFDLGGSDKLGMVGGSWDKGLTPEQAANFPGVKSSGALAFAPQNPVSDSAGAVDAMAAGGLKPTLVHSTNVPPPFSNQQADFAPLIPEQAQPQAAQQPVNAPQAPLQGEPGPVQAAPLAAPQANPDDILKAFLPEGADTTPAISSAAPTQETPDDILNSFLPKEGATTVGKPGKEPVIADAVPEKQSTFSDVIRSGASSVARGAMDLIGLPGTIQNAFDNSLSAITGIKAPPPSPLSGAGFRSLAAKASDGSTEYKPQTTLGKYVGTAGEFLPGALLGPENLLANAVKFGVVPGVASEAAGQATEGTKYEPYARFAGAVASPLAVEGGLRAAAGAGNKLASLSPTAAAGANIREALSASGQTAADVTNQLAANPRLTAMDVDPNLQQMAMKMATTPGDAKAVLKDAVDARAAGAKGAVSGAFDDALGQTPDVKAYLDNLKATTKANGAKAFGEALDNAKPVDVSPVLDAIDKVISPGVNGDVSQASKIPQGPVEQTLARLRGLLANDSEVLTDPQRLHSIQSKLRTDADTLASSASGQDRLVAGALRDVRSKLVDQIDQASGGKYKVAQKQYADDNAIQDAFDKGRTVLAGGTSSDSALMNRPEFWRDWVKNASQPEIDAAKVGARTVIDNQINTVRSAAAKGAAIDDVGFNKDRLEILLGKPEADKLAQSLADEQKIAKTNYHLFSGSDTATRQAANKLVDVTKVSPGLNLGPGAVGTVGGALAYGMGQPLAAAGSVLAGAGVSGIKMGAQAALRARDLTRNRLIAEAISGGPTQFQNAVNQTNATNKLATLLGSSQSPLLSATGAAVPAAASQNRLASPSRR